jgi:hypothetical protein
VSEPDTGKTDLRLKPNCRLADLLDMYIIVMVLGSCQCFAQDPKVFVRTLDRDIEMASLRGILYIVSSMMLSYETKEKKGIIKCCGYNPGW